MLHRLRSCLALSCSLFAASTTLAGDQCFCFGDLNDDGVVEGADLGLLLAGWSGNGLSDLNDDGTTDGADLGILLAAWGPCIPPFNDLCGDAWALDSVPLLGAGFCNVAATDSTSTTFPSCTDGPANIFKDVWFTYSPPQGGALNVSTCGPNTDFDTVVGVYTSTLSDNCACPGGMFSFASLLGCNDDECALQSIVDVPCEADKCYTIRVGSFGSDPGHGVLVIKNIFQGDRKDLCIPLPSTTADQTVIGTNDGDTWIDADPTSCGQGDIEDEWYCFTMPCQGTLTITTCNPGTDYDTTLAVFTANGVQIACNDDSLGAGCDIGGGQIVGSTVSISADGGEQVLIRVSGFNGATGVFEMTIDVDCIS